MNGTGAATFAPRDTVSRAEVVTTLFRIHHGRAASASDLRNTLFVDVPSNQWFAPYVRWASESGIVQGVGDNRFNASL